MPGLESLSDEDLEAIQGGNLNALSDSALEVVASYGEQPVAAPAQQQQGQDWRPSNLQNIIASGATAPFDVAKQAIVSGMNVMRFGGGQEPNIPAPEMAGASNVLAPMAQAGQAAAGLGGMVGPKTEKVVEFVAPQTEAQAAVMLGGELLGPAVQAIGNKIRPAMIKFGANLIKGTSGVPEKYGKAVLSDPAILTEAPTMDAAKKLYAEAIGSLKGAAEYLKDKTGKIVMKGGNAEELVNEVGARLANGEVPPLQEVLAARQANQFLLDMAKMGNPEQKANLRNLLKFRDEADAILESGLPGFKDASKAYFQANAREAFNSILPLNKNMSGNALRIMGVLSSVSAATLLHAPGIVVAALPMSPKATGYGIRIGSNALKLADNYVAQFAARVGAKNILPGEKK